MTIREQREGIRLVITDAQGSLRSAPQIAPPTVHQFPSLLAENALVSEIALASDGAYTIVARGPSEDGVTSDRALVKVSPNGNVLFSRPIAAAGAPQVVAWGSGVAVLSPDARALCPGPDSFAIAALDAVGTHRWLRCVPGRVAGLRLASSPSRLVVSGQFTARIDLGSGPVDVGARVASFVFSLDDRGATRNVATLDSSSSTLVQALAVTDDTIFVTAAVAAGAQQRSVLVAGLRE